MNMLKKLLKNQIGLSMTELMVATGTSGALLLGALSINKHFTDQTSEVTSDLESLMINQYTERIVLEDLRYSQHSFNNLVVPTKGQEITFYDLYLGKICLEGQMDCGRSFVLEIPEGQTKSKEFYVLRANDSLGIKYPMTPNSVYNLDAIGEDQPILPNHYLGLNHDGKITSSDTVKTPWKAKRLILLFTDVLTENNGLYKMFMPMRRIIFLGRVSKDEKDLDIVKFEKTQDGLKYHLNTTSPTDGKLDITSPHELFMNIPFTGGRLPLAYIEGVDLIRYHLEKVKTGQKDVYLAYRTVATVEESGKNSFTLKFNDIDKRVIGRSIKKMIFYRKNIENYNIYYDVEKLTSNDES